MSESATESANDEPPAYPLDYFPAIDPQDGKQKGINTPHEFTWIILQLLWLVPMSFADIFRWGKPKSLVIDSGLYMAAVMPSFFVLAVFISGWRRRRPNRFSLVRLLCVAVALAFVVLAIHEWDHDIWQDLGGYWDGP